MITYTEPTSWNDKNMDWENPQPGKADYIIALRNAFWERFNRSLEYFSATPCGQLHYDDLIALRALGPFTSNLYYKTVYGFLDPDHTYSADGSDFPYYLAYENLLLKDGCNFSILPPRGPTVLFKPFFKAIHNALNKLHLVYQKTGGHGYKYYNYDISRSEISVQAAISTALNSLLQGTLESPNFHDELSGGMLRSYSEIYPYYSDSDGKWSFRYGAKLQTYQLTGTDLGVYEHSSQFDSNVSLYVFASKIQGGSYEENIFDSNGIFQEGFNKIPIGKVSEGINHLIFPKWIPENTTVPSMENGHTIRGFQAKVFIVHEFSIDGGYRFRS